MPEAVNLIAQACAGIGYAHRAGIIHCDVKPHNMIITPDKRLKVTDFGIARALISINPDEHSDEVWGSPQYFSPEQAAGLAPSPASDVYSLGVVLYEMLTGQLPFTATDAQELARQHREVRPVPPRRLNREIPPELEQIILKVLSKEPAQRYRSADQLGRLLAPFAGTPEMLQPIPAEQPSARLRLQPIGPLNPPGSLSLVQTPTQAQPSPARGGRSSRTGCRGPGRSAPPSIPIAGYHHFDHHRRRIMGWHAAFRCLRSAPPRINWHALSRCRR